VNVNEIQDVLDVTQILGENGYGAEVNLVAALVDWKNDTPSAVAVPANTATIVEDEPLPEPVAPPTKSKPPAKKAAGKTAPPASDADPDF
jgi:hypothetical protein